MVVCVVMEGCAMAACEDVAGWAAELDRLGARHNRARYVGRNAAASVATGLASRHKAEQEALVSEALSLEG